ncbi:transglutaminase domain-containing protein [Lutibacter citreus]|uniref:transglutaminase domain-containing protein n=1 Tax=Lutibacter citreus TaxID=2138210 RepID=UPI000DBE6D63|nr:transglutaminase domain-containing protein [Lutibacter citreus]
MKKILLTLITVLTLVSVKGQNYKFGKISKIELEEKVYPLDSSANAAILFKDRKTYFRYKQNEGFYVYTDIHERIKIYNKEGYDWATKRIRYYAPETGEDEDVHSIDARTYELNNDKIKVYKLKKNEIFKEKLNKFRSVKKFTMPNITDGCIVEWKYKISSPYRSIDKVELQYEIPIKKIQSKITIPEYYKYNRKQLGYSSIDITNETKNGRINLNSKNRTGDKVIKTEYSNEVIEFLENITLIDNEDVPAIVEEDYVDNINNYKSSLSFELASVDMPGAVIKHYSKTWEDVAKAIYQEGHFELELNRSSYFKDDLEIILSKVSSDSEKAIAIFEFVKSKIKWNEYNGITTDEGVRKAYTTGVGNVADINLVLTAMFKKAGLSSNPVLSSTRSNGIPIFPTLNGLNYVLSSVEIDGKLLLFDATEKNAVPNILPKRAMNWEGIVVGEQGYFNKISLTNSQKSEISSTLSIKIGEEGAISGMSRTKYLNYYAMRYRNTYNHLKEEEQISKLEEEKGGIEIGNIRIGAKKDIYKPIDELFTFEAEDAITSAGDRYYIKPLFFNSINENSFKLKNREYPVNFNTKFSKKYISSIEIPEGYEIESVPEDIAIGLPNEFGVYRFKITQSGKSINVLTELSIDTVIYPATYYQQLKDFYKEIVKKNAEQIVLRKILAN